MSQAQQDQKNFDRSTQHLGERDAAPAPQRLNPTGTGMSGDAIRKQGEDLKNDDRADKTHPDLNKPEGGGKRNKDELPEGFGHLGKQTKAHPKDEGKLKDGHPLKDAGDSSQIKGQADAGIKGKAQAQGDAGAKAKGTGMA